MKLIIDRLTWLRGEGEGDSYLYRATDKKMCCLGFYALACGLSIKDIDSQTTPPEVHRTYGKVIADWLLDKSKFPESPGRIASDSCSLLMEVNDAYVTTHNEELDDPGHIESEELREAKIITEFAKHGVEVEFIN